ncbi:MAG: mobile mystery protein A [Pseudomonadales bacterium]|nr:mobile mystery protein A [Pseudomonadales bacterium]
MKKIVMHQYQDIIDKAAEHTAGLSLPPEGWLKTMRKALGMSGSQLARRLGVSRSQIAQSEKNELSGAVTLKTLQNTAEAMGGRLVYAIVPAGKVEALISKRAREKARQLVSRANVHMALESQTLDTRSREFEIKRLEQELFNIMPSDFWDDT